MRGQLQVQNGLASDLSIRHNQVSGSGSEVLSEALLLVQNVRFLKKIKYLFYLRHHMTTRPDNHITANNSL